MKVENSNSEERTDLENFAEDCKDFPEIMEALELLKESNYNTAELEIYERNRAETTTEKIWISDAFTDGKVAGKIEGKIEIARKLKEKGLGIEFIMDATGLEKEDIEKL